MYIKVRYQVLLISLFILLGTIGSVIVFDLYNAIDKSRNITRRDLARGSLIIKSQLKRQTDQLKTTVNMKVLPGKENRNYDDYRLNKMLEKMKSHFQLSGLFAVTSDTFHEYKEELQVLGINAKDLKRFETLTCGLTTNNQEVFNMCGYNNPLFNKTFISVKPINRSILNDFSMMTSLKTDFYLGKDLLFSSDSKVSKEMLKETCLPDQFLNATTKESLAKGIFEKHHEFMVYYFSVNSFNGEPLGIVAIGKGLPDFIAELKEDLKWHLLIYAVLFLLALLTSKKLGKRLIAPLELLHSKMGNPEEGSPELVEIPDRRFYDEVTDFMNHYNQMLEVLNEKERIKELFGKYVSREMRDTILSMPNAMEGTRKEMTVMFVDIANFTSFSEENEASKVINHLNSYFTKMVQVVHEHHGLVDKFLGDGMMILFGMKSDRNHALDAVSAGKRMLEEAEMQDIEIRVGIHTGEVVLGNIGTDDRMEYTAIGDTVNVAARLEQSGKTLGQPLVFSQNTYEKVDGLFKTKLLKELEIRGRQKRMNVYTGG